MPSPNEAPTWLEKFGAFLFRLLRVRDLNVPREKLLTTSFWTFLGTHGELEGLESVGEAV